MKEADHIIDKVMPSNRRCGRQIRLYLKKYNKFFAFRKILLAYFANTIYTNFCCGMIAVKREVAVSQ